MEIHQKYISTLRFTLIEFLVVLSTICILIGLLLPALNRVTELVDSNTCMNRQRHLVEASILFINDNNGTMPGKGQDWKKRTQLGQYVGNTNSWHFKKDNDIFFCPAAGEIAIYILSDGRYTAGGIAINGAVTGFGTRPEKYMQIQTSPAIWPLFTDGICTRWVGWGTMESFDDLDPSVTWASHEASYWSFAFRYSKRHNQSANVAFFDGHAANFPDLYEAKQDGELKYAWR